MPPIGLASSSPGGAAGSRYTSAAPAPRNDAWLTWPRQDRPGTRPFGPADSGKYPGVAAATAGDHPEPGGVILVYLVRHGQTPLNAEGVLRGLLDPPLDDTGRRQARRLGVVLGPRKPAAVIASPLRRARETAQPIAGRAGLVVAADRRLIDRDYGKWSGARREAVAAQWGSVDDAPGVEPLSEVRERAVGALADIVRRSHGHALVVVSHDAVNRQVLAALDPSLGEPGAIPQENGCFNTLEWQGGRWAVRDINQLPGAA
jgi:broad specificity phosphatase PhoE